MADRYPFAALEALVLVDVGPRVHDSGQDVGRARLVAEALGVDRRQVIRWRAIGVTADQADHLAVAAKRHPFEVWPELANAQVERVDTERRAKAARAQRRYLRRHAHARMANRAKARRYFEENRDYVLARERRRYWSDPEAARAKRRARYAANRDLERQRAHERYLRERERRLAYKRERDARKRADRDVAA